MKYLFFGIALILLLTSKAYSQDYLYLMDGNSFIVNVHEISTQHVAYYKYGVENNNKYAIPTNKVYSIKYADGKKELIYGTVFNPSLSDSTLNKEFFSYQPGDTLLYEKSSYFLPVIVVGFRVGRPSLLVRTFDEELPFIAFYSRLYSLDSLMESSLIYSNPSVSKQIQIERGDSVFCVFDNSIVKAQVQYVLSSKGKIQIQYPDKTIDKIYADYRDCFPINPDYTYDYPRGSNTIGAEIIYFKRNFFLGTIVEKYNDAFKVQSELLINGNKELKSEYRMPKYIRTISKR